MALVLVSQTVISSRELAMRTLETKWQIVSIFSIWINRRLNPLHRNGMKFRTTYSNLTGLSPTKWALLVCFWNGTWSSYDDTWFFSSPSIHIFLHSKHFCIEGNLLGSRCRRTNECSDSRLLLLKRQGHVVSEWRLRERRNVGCRWGSLSFAVRQLSIVNDAMEFIENVKLRCRDA